MRKWRWIVLVPISLTLVMCTDNPEVASQEGGGAPAVGPEGALSLPWKPKEIADTIEDLSDPEWKVRVEAIRNVVGAGRWMVPFLLVALKNPAPLNQQEVAYCLGRIGDPVAVPSLIEVLQMEPRYDVIVFTVDALGELGDRAAVEVLQPLLKYALEKEEYGRTIGPIELKAIESRMGTVRHAAAEALARLGDFSGMPLLIQGLTLNGWLRRDASVRLRQLTGGKVDFGFHLDMPDEEKKKVQEAWMAWWEENKASFKPVLERHRTAWDIYMPREKEKK
ncbi:MAG: HEAT repeat domain-containing protein [Planctomycetota bacterium]